MSLARKVIIPNCFLVFSFVPHRNPFPTVTPSNVTPFPTASHLATPHRLAVGLAASSSGARRSGAGLAARCCTGGAGLTARSRADAPPRAMAAERGYAARSRVSLAAGAATADTPVPPRAAPADPLDVTQLSSTHPG
jgi:hypothetical protein